MLLHAFTDGNFLAIGSHDNCIYIYGVSDNGRKYTRLGKCSVSVHSPPSPAYLPTGAWSLTWLCSSGSLQLHHAPGLVSQLPVPCVQLRRL